MVSIGEVVTEPMAVCAGGDLASAEEETFGSIAVLGFFAKKVDVDVAAYLGEARRCTRGEENSRGGGGASSGRVKGGDG